MVDENDINNFLKQFLFVANGPFWDQNGASS